MFNKVLSARLAEDNWDRLLRGDVLSLDGSGRLFRPQAEDARDSLRRRLAKLDIHVTGPLPGVLAEPMKYATCGQTADIENAVLAEDGEVLDWLRREGVRAGRRPLRFAARELDWRWTDGGLLLRFTLARGCYATSLLRELCIADDSEQDTELES